MVNSREGNPKGWHVMTNKKKNPQLEDGFTRIANELFEAILGFGFSERQLKIVFAIVRKTYGYNKKEDDMSASQIGELCGIKRNHVATTLGQLARMKVITKDKGSYGTILRINKNYQEWERQNTLDSPNSGVVPIQDVISPKLGQVDSPNSGHTKENLPKTNQQKKERSQRPRNSHSELCFADWLEKLKEAGETPIPEGHEVFEYAEKISLPMDYLRLCWQEFKREHMARKDKKQKDWPQTFSNYVRKNYYRLWFEKEGQWMLTTAGIQLQKEMRDAT